MPDIEPGTVIGDVVCPFCQSPAEVEVGKAKGNKCIMRCRCNSYATAGAYIDRDMKRAYLTAQTETESEEDDETSPEEASNESAETSPKKTGEKASGKKAQDETGHTEAGDGDTSTIDGNDDTAGQSDYAGTGDTADNGTSDSGRVPTGRRWGSGKRF